jgi:hypothetical protein
LCNGLFLAAAVVFVNNDDEVFRLLAGGGRRKMDDKRSGTGASRLCLVRGGEPWASTQIFDGGSEYEDYGEEGAK